MQEGDVSKQGTTAERFAALSRIGVALMSELDEARLLHMIAETACDLSGASFAAFTLRPIDDEGQPIVPSEGNLFYLAAIVGVTKEQEELLRQMPLGGEGLLAPIFRHGVPVRVDDAVAFIHQPEHLSSDSSDGIYASSVVARQAAFDYAHGFLPQEGLRSMGVPRGHPIIRSFLGAPLLNREKEVRGGLLLGHTEPGKFTQEDETLLVGLAAQAAVALENARLYHMTQVRAKQLDAIFEGIADGVTLVDGQGNILRENGAARCLRETLTHTAEDQQALEDLLYTPARLALRGESSKDMTVTVRDTSQEAREYLVNASSLRLDTPPSGHLEQHTAAPLPEGSAVGAVVVWHDVTEARRLLLERRMHAETEARLALLQLLLDELPSSVYLVRGRDARLVLANQMAETVWGVRWPAGQPMGEFLQQNGIRIFGTDGHILTSQELATMRAVQHGETVRQHQEVIRHPNGTTLPVLVNAVALGARELNVLSPSSEGQASQGEEPAAIVVHQDVTALKEAEQLKDEFVGIAAHELRTPLAVLQGFVQTLLVQTARGKGPALADWQTEALQDINQATSRLGDLIADLLDVTRLQAGRLRLHYEPTDLIALTRRVMTRLQMTTEQHTLSLHTSLEHLVVSSDPQRLDQVLSNLINNAIKYSPNGGPVTVSIGEDAQAHEALFSVHDTGIGIPAHQQTRVFGRFMRADNARAYGIGGTGLGLYLSREIIERLAGRIWFESTVGQGSTFFIALPLLPASVQSESYS
jgi:signal transduction histidine kinase